MCVCVCAFSFYFSKSPPNHAQHNIELIIDIHFRKPKEREIIYNLNHVKHNLPQEYQHLIDSILNGPKSNRVDIHVS